jgi:uncharacterized protein (DUF2267 family)
MMNYHELIHMIKESVGAGEDESQDALEIVVENVAAHLTDPTRREFAAALPDELQSAAMMVPTADRLDEDLIEQLMDLENVDESQAKSQIRAAWHAVRDLFDHDEVEDITAQLPRRIISSLD